MGKISVFLSGRDNVIRDGLRRTLESEDFEVSVREDASVLEDKGIVLDSDSHSQPASLVIFDAGNSAGEDLEQIRSTYPNARVVVLADNFDYDVVIKAFRDGVDGYIVKEIRREPLIESLRLVALGEKVVPSALVQHLPDAIGHNPPMHDIEEMLESALSDREIDTFRLMCVGDPNKVIAQRLGISEATVKVHVKAILRKLGLRNRTEAVSWAYAGGFDPNLPATAKAA